MTHCKTPLSLSSRLLLELDGLGIGRDPAAIPGLPRSLSTRLGLSTQRVYRLLAALERHGQLRVERPTRRGRGRRRAGPGRGRCNRYSLTPDGEARLKRLLAKLSKDETSCPGLPETHKTISHPDPTLATVSVRESHDDALDYAEDRKHLGFEEPSAPTGTGSPPENERGLRSSVTEEGKPYNKEHTKEPPKELTDEDLRRLFKSEMNITLDVMRSLSSIVREHLAQRETGCGAAERTTR